jgi:hypothetical protein
MVIDINLPVVLAFVVVVILVVVGLRSLKK